MLKRLRKNLKKRKKEKVKSKKFAFYFCLS